MQGIFFLTHTSASCRIFFGLIPIYQQLNHFDNNEIKVLEDFIFVKTRGSWTLILTIISEAKCF
jgi:hypothetical protein